MYKKLKLVGTGAAANFGMAMDNSVHFVGMESQLIVSHINFQGVKFLKDFNYIIFARIKYASILPIFF